MSAERRSIVDYLEWASNLEVGTVLTPAERQGVQYAASWIRNRLDESGGTVNISEPEWRVSIKGTTQYAIVRAATPELAFERARGILGNPRQEDVEVDRSRTAPV